MQPANNSKTDLSANSGINTLVFHLPTHFGKGGIPQLSGKAIGTIASGSNAMLRLSDGLQPQRKPRLPQVQDGSEPSPMVILGKQMLEAAKVGNNDEITTLMSSGAPFSTDWLGTSPLHLAAWYGHKSTCQMLIRAGMHQNQRTKVDRTPVHFAAEAGHSHIVEHLLLNGANVNAKDMLRMTPLHWGVQRQFKDVVEVLLKNGAEISCKNKFDKTPLDIALDLRNYDIIHLIEQCECGLLNGMEGLSSPTRDTTTTTTLTRQQQQGENTATPTSPTLTPVSVTTVATSVHHSIQLGSAAQASAGTTLYTLVSSPGQPLILAPVSLTGGQIAGLIPAGGTPVIMSAESETQQQQQQQQHHQPVLDTLRALVDSAVQTKTSNKQTTTTTTAANQPGSGAGGGQILSLTEAGKLALKLTAKTPAASSTAFSSLPPLSKNRQKSSLGQAVPITPIWLTSPTQGHSTKATILRKSPIKSNPANKTNPVPVKPLTPNASRPPLEGARSVSLSAASSQTESSSETTTTTETKTESEVFVEVSDDYTDGDPVEPATKRIKTAETKEPAAATLQRQLEAARLEAQEFKKQLMIIQHTAQVYKQQLDEMSQKLTPTLSETTTTE